MARWINADELLRRLKVLKEEHSATIEYGVDFAMVEVNDMLRAEEYVTDTAPNGYPRTLDAIRNELTTAVGLVDRLREAGKEAST